MYTRAAFGARCPGGCSGGRKYNDREDETGRTCGVCGGSGSVPDDELFAWKQDPSYERSIRPGAHYPRTYIGFYDDAFLTHIKGEVARGNLPPITLREFIAQKRAEQGAPRIDARLIRKDMNAADVRLRCPAECFDGRTLNRNGNDPETSTSSPCTMCAPYEGKGTIPAATLAQWMSDPHYREYHNGLRHREGERISYDAWVRRRGRGSATSASLPPAPPTPGPPSTLGAVVNWMSGRGRTSPTAQPGSPDEWGAASARKKPKVAEPEEAHASEPADPKICVICYERAKNTIFIPCGHLACCDTCAAGLHRCPVCRAIGTKYRVFDVTAFGAHNARVANGLGCLARKPRCALAAAIKAEGLSVVHWHARAKR